MIFLRQLKEQKFFEKIRKCSIPQSIPIRTELTLFGRFGLAESIGEDGYIRRPIASELWGFEFRF